MAATEVAPGWLSHERSGKEMNTGQVTGQVTGEIKKLVQVCISELSRKELQSKLKLKHRDNFTDKYLKPALEAGFIEMTIPEKPRSSKQKYRLTIKGKSILEVIVYNKFMKEVVK